MGYSFTWILNHLSQSFVATSASYAISASNAGTASFVTASNVYGPFGTNSILSSSHAVTASYITLLEGPNIDINYYPYGIAISASAGTGAPGGLYNTIQYNSGGYFSGSSTFTYISSSNTVYLTGSMIVSGAISASVGPNTVGFYGTASYAQTASYIKLAGQNITIDYYNGYIGLTGSAGTSTPSDGIWERSFGTQSAVLVAPNKSYAGGTGSVAFGADTSASGDFSLAHGYTTLAAGGYAHAEGYYAIASGSYSHAEGAGTRTTGDYAHAEGDGTIAGAGVTYLYSSSIDIQPVSVFSSGYVDSGVFATSDFMWFDAINQYPAYNTPLYVSASGPSGTEVYLVTSVTTPDFATFYLNGGSLVFNDHTYATPHVASPSVPIGSLMLPIVVSHYKNVGTVGIASHAEGIDTKAHGDGTHAQGYGTQAGYYGGILVPSSAMTTNSLDTETHITIPGVHVGVGAAPWSNSLTTSPVWTLIQVEYKFTSPVYSNWLNPNDPYQDFPIDTGLLAPPVTRYTSVISATSNGTNTFITASGNLFKPPDSYYNRGSLTGLNTSLFGPLSGSFSVVLSPTSLNNDYPNTNGGDWYGDDGITPYLTESVGNYSHAEGFYTVAYSQGSHAEGYKTVVQGGPFAHAEGVFTSAYGEGAHGEGCYTTAFGISSHTEGAYTRANGFASHAEGVYTRALSTGSHAEGYYAIASGSYSHAEGYSTIATGSYSHAEGGSTQAIGASSHAEGFSTTTQGAYSHAEGISTTAVGSGSHAEGSASIAYGKASHAEGYLSVAYGTGSHAQGLHTIASGSYQQTVGQYNLKDNTTDLFVIGDGISNTNRHDLLNASVGLVRITGSAIVSSSLTVIGVSTVSGSNIITGSWQLIGNGQTTGSQVISSSLTVIGTSVVTGSNTITGSWFLIGNGQTTGSQIISSSLTVIGSSIVTGSNVVTGSWQLVGSGQVTGSLVVSSSFTTIGFNITSGSSIITGSQQLTGQGYVTGSLIVSNSLNVIGSSIITGSNIISGSFNLIGSGIVTGSLIVSNSLDVIGVLRLSGSFIDTGSFQLIGDGRVTGSLIVSNSLQVIGTNTTTGSLLATGSMYLVGNEFITGSIYVTGGLVYGTSSWATNAVNATNADYLNVSFVTSSTDYLPLLAANTNSTTYSVGIYSLIRRNPLGLTYLPLSSSVKITALATSQLPALIVSSSNAAPGISVKGDVVVSGSSITTGSVLVKDGVLQVSSSSALQVQPAIQTNTQGVFVLGEFTNSTSPTSVVGGIIYSGSEYYLGFV